MRKTDANGNLVHFEDDEPLKDGETGRVVKTAQEKLDDAIKAVNNKYEARANARVNKAHIELEGSTTRARNNELYTNKQYTYSVGCKDGYYLKKYALKNDLLKDLFNNGEMPVCAFDEDGEKGYFYYISADGTVHCSCPECHN